MSLNESDCISALYKGIPVTKLEMDADIRTQYLNSILDLPDLSVLDQWFMPKEYSEMDLSKYFDKFDLTIEQRTRVEEELMLMEMAGASELVKYTIYLVHTMNKHNIVWGVGRGSSVSIYIFYLIGLHKVDSFTYKLDYLDFFKIKET